MTTGINDLPVEIVVEIGINLDFASFDGMLLVCKRLRSILEKHWIVIMRKIVEDEFTPGDGFLNAFEGTTGHKTAADAKNGNRSLTKVEGGMQAVLNFCRAVKLWEEEFQRLRFFDLPAEYRRSFLPHELQKLRQGLYIWRRYALCFHAGGERKGQPPETMENQYRFMRQYSLGQLYDVEDAWRTVWSAVGREVCPSVERVMELSSNMLSRAEAERVGWGDHAENYQILATVMKLLPEDMLHLLLHRHRYATKASVVQFIRMRNPWIEDSTESLSRALLGAKYERETFGLDTTAIQAFGGEDDHDEADLEDMVAICSRDDGEDGDENENEAEGEFLSSNYLGFRHELCFLGNNGEGRLVPRGDYY